IAKWAIKLREHDFEFKGRNSVKGHILADFLAETPSAEGKDTKIKKPKIVNEEPKLKDMWKLYTDRASSFDGSDAGLMLVSLEKKEYTYALRFEFETTKNKAEYEALLPVIKQYLDKTKEIIESFNNYTMKHVRRGQNKKVDALSKLASMTFSYLANEVLDVTKIQQHRNSLQLNLWLGSRRSYRNKCRNRKDKGTQSQKNDKRLREDLDILEERREIASIIEAHYKQKLERYYNKHVRPSTFKPGTYVLRLNSASKVEFQGKIGPTWEGPYIVRKTYGDGAYKLETLFGSPVDRTWNSLNLRKLYM
ncbi:reverse transcriptase domain-containing protein, partial [Tanacetum coccineum]